jgi:hypothetical protein
MAFGVQRDRRQAEDVQTCDQTFFPPSSSSKKASEIGYQTAGDAMIEIDVNIEKLGCGSKVRTAISSALSRLN